MTHKRTIIRIRRTLCLAALLIGAVCGWNTGTLIVQNAVHGWQQIPQLAVTASTAWTMAKAVNYLKYEGRRAEYGKQNFGKPL